MFNTETYKKIWILFLESGEKAREDTVLADMDEPQGEKISLLPTGFAHSTSTCKAFVTTTTADKVFIAIFDIYGKFHKFYCAHRISDLTIKKSFGGNQISFTADTQHGKVKMDMYVANHQFGTDLKNQKAHKELLIKHLDDISKRVISDDAVNTKNEIASIKGETKAFVTNSKEEKPEYPISELIKNAPKLKTSWGHEFLEPLGTQVVCYKNKEFLYYAEDKYYNTVLMYTGNPKSVEDGFVLEGQSGGTCKKIGSYNYLYTGAYYKEVKKEELDCSFHRTFFAIYNNDNDYKFSLTNIMEDRFDLELCMYVHEMPCDFDEQKLLAMGFEKSRYYSDHSAWQDRWTFTKREIPYNDPNVKIFVHRDYYNSDRFDVTEEFWFL